MERRDQSSVGEELTRDWLDGADRSNPSAESRPEVREVDPARQVEPARAPDPVSQADGSAGPQPRQPDNSLRRLGKFELHERLGQGGMGEVWRAVHAKLQKTVALKLLRSERMDDPESLQRFQREMRLVSQLSHPNIVRFESAGETDGTCFLAMELVEGISFDQLLGRLGPLPVADACQLIGQAAVGLEYARQFGVVHRDVKPSNLMLTHTGTVKILDFGLARLAESTDTMTSSGRAVGTVDFLAPEQAAAGRDVGTQADIYSLGCSLYCLLVGHPPFRTSPSLSPQQVLLGHVTAPVPSARAARADVPPQLDDLLARMLAKNVEDRPATPAEVAMELATLASGCDVRALMERAELAPPVEETPGASSTGTAEYLKLAAATLTDTARLESTRSDMTLDPAADAKQRRSGHRSTVKLRLAAALLASVLVLGLLGTFLVPWYWLIRTTERPDRAASVEVTTTDQPAAPASVPRRASAPRPVIGPGPAAANRVSGVRHAVAGKAELTASVIGTALPLGERVRLTIAVRRDRIEVRRDGESWLNWTGDPATLAIHKADEAVYAGCLFLHNHRRAFAIRRLDLYPLSGWPRQIRLSPDTASADRLAAELGIWKGATAWLHTDQAGTRSVVHLEDLPSDLRLDRLPARDSSIGVQWTDEDLALLERVPGLRQLDLSRSQVTDAGLEHLQRMPALESLSLSFTRITDDGLSSLAGLTNLKTLYLSSTPVTDLGMEHLQGLRRLEQVGLSSTKVGDPGIQTLLPAMQGTSWICLCGTPVTAAILPELSRLPSLRTLHLGSAKVQDGDLPVLFQFERLMQIRLQGTGVSDRGLQDLKRRLPNLELLD